MVIHVPPERMLCSGRAGTTPPSFSQDPHSCLSGQPLVTLHWQNLFRWPGPLPDGKPPGSKNKVFLRAWAHPGQGNL